MEFSSFQAIVFWLAVREITTPSGTSSLTWYYETSPSKDNNLFTPMDSVQIAQAIGLTPGLQTPLKKIILANNPTVPLATWARWRLSPAGTASTWDATFRVLVAANRVVRDRAGAGMYG